MIIKASYRNMICLYVCICVCVLVRLCQMGHKTDVLIRGQNISEQLDDSPVYLSISLKERKMKCQK